MLVSRKLQENQSKNVQKEIIIIIKKTNENQRKSVDEVEEQKENLKSVSMSKEEVEQGNQRKSGGNN